MAKALNDAIKSVLIARGIPLPPVDVVQRNQNQSAVGGGDLTNPFEISFEIKRHEQLSVNTWWEQCETAARRNGDLPILIFRQNTAGGGRRKWRVVMYANLDLFAPAGQSSKYMKARVEISWEDFLQWFRAWVEARIYHGQEIRV